MVFFQIGEFTSVMGMDVGAFGAIPGFFPLVHSSRFPLFLLASGIATQRRSLLGGSGSSSNIPPELSSSSIHD